MRIYLLTTLRNYIVKSGTEVIMNGNEKKIKKMVTTTGKLHKG